MSVSANALDSLLRSAQADCISERSKARALFYALQTLCHAIEMSDTDFHEIRREWDAGRTTLEALREHYDIERP